MSDAERLRFKDNNPGIVFDRFDHYDIYEDYTATEHGVLPWSRNVELPANYHYFRAPGYQPAQVPQPAVPADQANNNDGADGLDDGAQYTGLAQQRAEWQQGVGAVDGYAKWMGALCPPDVPDARIKELVR
jgi:hypothetical protein